MIQLILHGIGDYIIQTEWMAQNKKKRTIGGEIACQLHCITYALPFLLIGSWKAVLVIYITHYLIDRTRFIDYFLAVKNRVKKWEHYNPSMVYDISNFGLPTGKPVYMSIWLYIITDNVFHLTCNYLALKYL